MDKLGADKNRAQQWPYKNTTKKISNFLAQDHAAASGSSKKNKEKKTLHTDNVSPPLLTFCPFYHLPNSSSSTTLPVYIIKRLETRHHLPACATLFSIFSKFLMFLPMLNTLPSLLSSNYLCLLCRPSSPLSHVLVSICLCVCH